MLKLTRSLFGAIIAVASIGANAQTITATAHPGRIQQIPLNLQAQFYHKASDSSPSFGDPSRQIDRPAGFGSLNNYPPSFYPGGFQDTSTKCPAGYERDSRCYAPTTANDGKSSKSTPAVANVRKNTPPVNRSNYNSNRNLDRRANRNLDRREFDGEK